MVAEGNADESSTDATLKDACEGIQGIANEGRHLEWDYLYSKFGLSQPPGSKAVADYFNVHDVKVCSSPSRLQVAIDTPSNVRGVLIVYRGPFDAPSPGGSWRIYIGVYVTGKHVFTEIPIAGKIDDGAIELRGVQLLVTSHDMTANECKAIFKALRPNETPNTLGDINYTATPTPPLDGIKSRVTFKADVQLATANYPLVVDIGPDEGAPPAKASDSSDDKPGKPQAPSASATPNKWIGPLLINQVSADYDTEACEFGIHFDATVSLGVFKLTFLELKAALSLKDNKDNKDDKDNKGNGATAEPVFSLKGVAVSGGSPDVAQFSGELYVEKPSPLNLWGGVVVGFPQNIGVSVMAGYANVDGQDSFFLFGFVKVPIGGPPFLEVRGLALGGAYNRALAIPAVEALDKFPFIQAAMSFANPSSNEFKNPFTSDPDSLTLLSASLKTLGKAAPPKSGSYWVTAGVAFSSFKVLNGFALVSVAFGKSTQVSVLGEMQIRMPPPQDGLDNVKPLVFIDTFLRAVLDINKGEFALEAYVKNNSYIVEKDAHLMGGFALRVWYKGKHRGQFVVSAGGYSPSVDLKTFNYYPVVPRLSMTMKLADGVQIQSKMYFAITSSMIMYGVAFEVSGKWGPAHVWAIVAFDELIAWDPFYYDLYVAVEFGASLRIKVLFVHITITVHVGASLHIWGPSFSGRARLDLGVCTISFNLGANASPPAALTWKEFKDKYLTDARTDPDEPSAPAKADEQKKAVADIQVASTPLIVLKRQYYEDARWVVDPESLVIRTSSQIPSKSWSTDILGKLDSGTGKAAFGVGPCDIADDRFHTTHIVKIANQEGSSGTDFKVSPQFEAVPASLWKTGSKKPIGPDSTVTGVIAGLELRPTHPKPDRTLPADAENLLVSTDALELLYFQANTDHTTETGFDDASVSGSIASERAVNNRQKLFGAIKAHLLPGDTPDVDPDTVGWFDNGAHPVDVSGFANGKDANLFVTQPRKRLLGEDRA